MTQDEIMTNLEDGQSAQLCDRYETEIVAEARAIAEGRSMKLATGEHLRVLLSWLDGRPSAKVESCPF